MANYKYNGKMLNGISSYDMNDRDSKQRLMSPTDNSGNKVVAGMEVLYLPGVKYARPVKVQVIEIEPDNESFTVLGFKQKNGQYCTIYGCNCYILTTDFMNLHPGL